jgi:hypothetical protein
MAAGDDRTVNSDSEPDGRGLHRSGGLVVRTMQVAPAAQRVDVEAFDRWPGSPVAPLRCYHYDAGDDTAWVRLSPRHVDELAAVAVADFPTATLRVHLAADGTVLAIGATRASSWLPAAALIRGSMPSLVLRYSPPLDEMEIAFAPGAPMEGTEIVRLSAPATPWPLRFAAVVEPGNVLASVVVTGASHVLDPGLLDPLLDALGSRRSPPRRGWFARLREAATGTRRSDGRGGHRS